MLKRLPRTLRNLLIEAPAIGELTTGRNNNFNLIRFLAASIVILFHESGIAQTPGMVEPFLRLTHGRDDGGSLAVAVFFILSGFLVTQSYVARDGHLAEFFSARALRILPGLWVAVIFTIIVSSFASAVPWGAYLTRPLTLNYWWHNSFLWQMQFNLPGAFLHVPIPRIVNGSLWTLPMEARMYLICAALGVCGLYTSRAVFNAFLLIIFMTGAMVQFDHLPLAENTHVVQWALAFLIGAALFVNRHEVRLSIPVALLLLGTTYFFRNPNTGRICILPALAYATLCFSLHPLLFFRPFTRIGDYSYGLYIYAFPLQQLVVFYHPGIHWLPGFALTYPIILAVSIVSWHFLEKPALTLKRVFHRRTLSDARREPALVTATR